MVDFKHGGTRLLLGALLLLSFERVRGAEPVRLRVLSYNIHHAEGVDRKLDLPRIARVIQSVKPDVVALQEVDFKARRTQAVDQPAELARLTQMRVAFGANIPLQGGKYGNAVLSRFPILRSKNHALPNFDRGEQRGVLEVHLEVSGMKQPLLVWATHLDHRRPDRERVASAKAINQLLAPHLQRPALLAGDMNDVHGSATLAQFESMWSHTTEKPQATIPVDHPTRQIDFICFRPKQSWKVLELKVLDEAVASDHRAVFAVLEYVPAPAP